jgi:ADP-ribosylglycohydrolase
MPLPPDYENCVYAGWLGKCIGVRFGAPLENWTYEEIRDNLGELTTYLREDNGKIFKPDDDTAVPMLLIRALEAHGEDVTPEQIGDMWLNLLGDQHGTLWWGGYGISTEHTVYSNLAAGIPATQAGTIAQNGAALAEQIGGQIFSDVWGLVLPDNPARAAALAAKFSSVTHDGTGIEGGKFIAALVSAAFCECDPVKLIATALRQLQPGGEYARVVMAMAAFHKDNPADWRAAYDYLKANFGYDRYPGMVHIIPNAGVVVLALLYGAGDFTRSIQIANMCGWDTDCNVGNVGTIIGTAVGIDGIEEFWRTPLNDLLIASGIIGTRNILTIPQCADLFCALGRKLHGETSEPRPRYHFHYLGSTNNFSADGEKGRPIHWQQVELDGTKALSVAVRKLTKKGELRAYTRTYYRPSELSSNYYEACFTPLVYPGQTVAMRLFLPADAPDTLLAALYVHDLNATQHPQAEGTPLVPGQWHDLSYSIPMLTDACLSEVGVVLRNLGEEWTTGSFQIERLDWSGTANYCTSFAKVRHESGGISQWTRLRGYWRLEDGAYHGSGVGACESYTGDIAWTDATIEAELTPLSGEHHLVMARVQGALWSYAFGLAPDGCVGLYKKDKTHRLISSLPFSWAHGEIYRLSLHAEGDMLTGVATTPNGTTQTISIRDFEAPYLSGQIGVATWDGGHTAFHLVNVR